MHVRRALLVIPFLTACIGPADDHGGEPLGVAVQANVCATGTVLQGVDVSTYDGTVDWPTAKANGIVFGIAKATEGVSLEDDQFSTNWPAMKQDGVVRGAYHFFHCDDDPSAQATFFLSVVGTLQPGDLPPVLDFEDSSCPASTAISLAVEWLDAVASATGTLPILYCSPGFIGGLDDPGALAGHAQLWVADWGPSCPELPAPFTTWPIWQYSSTGTVPGVDGNTPGMADLDEFNGDLAALKGITVGGSSASTSASSSSGAGGAPAGPPCMVDGVAGVCIDTSACAAMPGYVSTPGFCPGPVNEQCCTPTGSGGAGGSSSTGAGGAPAGSGGAPTTGTTTGVSSSGAITTGAGTGGAGAGSPGTVHLSSSCSASPRGATHDAGLGARLIACFAAVALGARARRRSRG
jgi:lysozyme